MTIGIIKAGKDRQWVRGLVMGAGSTGTVRRASLRVLAASAMVLALSACGSTPNDTYDLATRDLMASPVKAQAQKRQILVQDPTALKVLDSEMIVVRVSGTEMQYLAKSQWSDKLPRMVQAKLVEAFENTGKLGGVGKPGQGLAIDYQLISDIRSFEIEASGGRHAKVEISAKLLNDRNGTVIAQRVFSAVVPARSGDNQAMVDALSQAFAKVSGDIVAWTLTVI
ncbi:cholesterol transport system auxiliary component [Rhizobium paknamense]|uniref:Cholesterol transport system auxiliary component n=2 Tax=Rhizobium paknamense TaxID=1206817 RepID=A0ABU0ICN5_9HYPH|nr:cholesterol transport system auxiliary component [Rhizobium paknamense]